MAPSPYRFPLAFAAKGVLVDGVGEGGIGFADVDGGVRGGGFVGCVLRRRSGGGVEEEGKDGGKGGGW